MVRESSLGDKIGRFSLCPAFASAHLNPSLVPDFPQLYSHSRSSASLIFEASAPTQAAGIRLLVVMATGREKGRLINIYSPYYLKLLLRKSATKEIVKALEPDEISPYLFYA